MGPEAADGTLVILVCRAKHLPNRRKLDKQSPYVTIRLGTTAKKTPSHFRAGQTPEWTYEIRFQLTRERKPVLKVDVLDETKNDPTPIGNVEIDGSIIFNPENKKIEYDVNGKPIEKYIHDKWYDLTLNGRRAGILYLEMTFYPSAPVVPPKISLPMYPEHELEDPYRAHHHLLTPSQSHSPSHSYSRRSPTQGHGFSSSAPSPGKELPKPPPQHISQSKPKTAADEIFVTGKDPSKFSSLTSMFKSSAGNNNFMDKFNENPEVFVNEDKPSGKYSSKFNLFTKKFQSKEKISNLFNLSDGSKRSSENSAKNSARGDLSRSISPITVYDVDNLDKLERDVQSRYYQSPTNDYHEEEPSPPLPPPHLERASRSSSPTHRQVDDEVPPPVPSHHSHKKSPARRRPPPESPSTRSRSSKDLHDFKNLSIGNTSIPFSADTIGLEDDEEGDNIDSLPTKVYLLDEPVKSLSHPGALATGEINPKYYAPTPSERFNKSLRLQNGNPQKSDVRVDYRTSETGYLGEGKWATSAHHANNSPTKFSPTIFDRMPVGNDENLGFENKPHVPPKIPQGMSEMEYYVLEKEKFLKDINGRRM